MFITSFLNSIKPKEPNNANNEEQSRNVACPKHQLHNSQKPRLSSEPYEETKLNKTYSGPDTKQTELVSDASDLMAEFVVVDYKEYEPYTEQEWEELLVDSGIVNVDQQRLYVSLHKGIPKRLRKRIWLYLADVDQLKRENAKKGGEYNMGEIVLKGGFIVTYDSLLAQECRDRHNIRKDITRTFPNHEFFSHQRKDRLQHLENVLRAYAVFDTEVGYTQGMNFLVGTLVYYMHLERTETDYYVIDRDFESDIFWILVHIMHKKGWRSLYIDNTPKLVDLLAKLEARIKKELPRLFIIFDEHGLIPACFSQCFLTLLFYNSPLRFAKRVLDMFLLAGEDIVLELLVKMLALCQNDILEKKGIEELYPFLRSQLVEFTFQKYEKEFANLVAEQSMVRIIEYE